MNNFKDYTMFVSVWGWQILAMIFLSFSILFLTLPETLKTNVFFYSFLFLFIGCEVMSIKRKREFYETD